MAELIAIVAQEAELSIDQAFDEGFKKGFLAAAPNVEYWRVKANQYEKEIAQLKKEKWLFCFSGFSAGLALGGGIGFSIRILE